MAGLMQVYIQEKRFPGRGPMLRNLSLDLAGGETLAVLGSSGVGKSTLLRIVAGLDRDFRGTIVGQPERTGFQFQEPTLLPWRSALDNVALACGSRAMAQVWLDRLGVGHAAGLLPAALSLGMARRVSLARALSVEPDLLLLDEPTAGLDRAAATRVRSTIRDAVAAVRPILLVATHSTQEAVELAERQIVLGGGGPSPSEAVA